MTTATLHHGDCLAVMGRMEANSVDAVITDPPYGLDFPYLSYDDTRDNLIGLIGQFVPEAQRISNRVFVLCGPTQIGLYPQPDWILSIVWNTTGSFGRFGYNQWTPVLCYGEDLNGFGNVNGVTKSDVIKINGGGGVGFTRTELEKNHTCPKPITIMTAVIERLTRPEDTVLDPFCGSGTTGVACVLCERQRFIGIDKESVYVEVSRRRINETLGMFGECEVVT